jgi:3-phenylpropionate/cinnamic acid dioxygenase small subunit
LRGACPIAVRAGAGTAPMDQLADKVAQFLYHEARLMDAHRYDEWLALWEDDATYWVPCGDGESDPAHSVSVIYDRGRQLRNRIQRLKETLWLKERAPRLKRLVSNIEIEPAADGPIVVRSNFILVELHRHRQILWAGESTHHLATADGGGFRIRFKKVLLLNSDEPLPNLMFLI